MKKVVFFITLLIMTICFSAVVSAESYVYSASVSGEIALHLSPEDESYVVAKIPACSRLRLLEKNRTWGLVEFMNKTGWINLSFTYNDYEKAAEATGSDSVGSVQIRTEDGKATLYNAPSTEKNMGSNEEYQVPDGTILKITRKTDSGWGLVSMNGKYAWIQMAETVPHKDETNPQNQGIYYVYVLSENGSGLELWDTAAKENLYAVIPDCAKLTIRETNGEYAYVSYDGINGWIELKYTAESLANAQLNAGTAVNSEYIVVPQNDADSVDVFSVPSDKEADGGRVVVKIKRDEYVFVLRSNVSGWSLVNYGGSIGWIPPGNLVQVEKTENAEFLTVLKNHKVGYVSTYNGRGVKVYADNSEKTEIATLPEGIEVKIIAKKEGYDYIISDYASGWTKGIPLTETYEESMEKYPAEKRVFYMTSQETKMMSLPTENHLCGTKELLKVPKGEYLEAIKMAVTEKDKWVLTKIDGQMGWIMLAHTDKARISGMTVLLIIVALSVVLAFAAFIVYVIRKVKKKIKRKINIKRREDEKNAERIQVKHSRVEKKPSDVSGKR